ncbi:hypothetical protein K438DRAFT_1758016 [Mycena galopus ATCC 62051]|nr:hypothetical protein K438DRAFT_1758016 [Mycena galopus ATCC 62051]
MTRSMIKSTGTGRGGKVPLLLFLRLEIKRRIVGSRRTRTRTRVRLDQPLHRIGCFDGLGAGAGTGAWGMRVRTRVGRGGSITGSGKVRRGDMDRAGKGGGKQSEQEGGRQSGKAWNGSEAHGRMEVGGVKGRGKRNTEQVQARSARKAGNETRKRKRKRIGAECKDDEDVSDSYTLVRASSYHAVKLVVGREYW